MPLFSCIIQADFLHYFSTYFMFPHSWKTLHFRDYDLAILEILKFLHNVLYFLGLSFLTNFIHKIGISFYHMEFWGGSNEMVYLNHREACLVHPWLLVIIMIIITFINILKVDLTFLDMHPV